MVEKPTQQQYPAGLTGSTFVLSLPVEKTALYTISDAMPCSSPWRITRKHSLTRRSSWGPAAGPEDDPDGGEGTKRLKIFRLDLLESLSEAVLLESAWHL